MSGMSTKAPSDNALSAVLKRKRAAATKTVSEFYQIERLGNTDLYQFTHPNDSSRSYLVNLYDQECNCPGYRPGRPCKHLACAEKLKLPYNDQLED
jgi:hypothetical protein